MLNSLYTLTQSPRTYPNPHGFVKRLASNGVIRTLTGIKRGLEKESLRIDASGHLALTPHPECLGTTLTHPQLTTDYSEALLEFVTPPSEQLDEPLVHLSKLHAFVYQHLAPLQESLWPLSMPCVLLADQEIPIAEYGSSNIGQLKHVYRRGLGWRYGRLMQTIAGVHYNFSLPDTFWQCYRDTTNDKRSLREVKETGYFHLIRNFIRLGWVVPFVMGASPAVCGSLVKQNPLSLVTQDNHTFYHPFATSLRLSDIGYQNKEQGALPINYNSLSQYTLSLRKALLKPSSQFEKIGLQKEGEWCQLNTNLLQLEAEYYAPIRPKAIPHGETERMVQALDARGVEYIEIRSIDLNPNSMIGIAPWQSRFLDVFLVYCLLLESPDLSLSELQDATTLQKQIALTGRDPYFQLKGVHEGLSPREAFEQMFEVLIEIAGWFDAVWPEGHFSKSCNEIKAHIAMDDLPARQALETVLEKNSYFQYGLEIAKMHQKDGLQTALAEEDFASFTKLAMLSHERRACLEAQSLGPFADYLSSYLDSVRILS